jgi:hypothetical protein
MSPSEGNSTHNHHPDKLIIITDEKPPSPGNFMYVSYGCEAIHLFANLRDPREFAWTWTALIAHESTHKALSKVAQTEDHGGYHNGKMIDNQKIHYLLMDYYY